jgi:hypothetical protein
MVVDVNARHYFSCARLYAVRAAGKDIKPPWF